MAKIAKVSGYDWCRRCRIEVASWHLPVQSLPAQGLGADIWQERRFALESLKFFWLNTPAHAKLGEFMRKNRYARAHTHPCTCTHARTCARGRLLEDVGVVEESIAEWFNREWPPRQAVPVNQFHVGERCDSGQRAQPVVTLSADLF